MLVSEPSVNCCACWSLNEPVKSEVRVPLVLGGEMVQALADVYGRYTSGPEW